MSEPNKSRTNAWSPGCQKNTNPLPLVILSAAKNLVPRVFSCLYSFVSPLPRLIREGRDSSLRSE